MAISYEVCRYYKVKVLECDCCHDEVDKNMRWINWR